MPNPMIISDANRWPHIAADPQRLADLQKWLVSNGIDYCNVPITSTLSVETHPHGGHRIRYTVFLQTAGGQYYREVGGRSAACEERTTAMIVRPPASLQQAQSDPVTPPPGSPAEVPAPPAEPIPAPAGEDR